MYTLDESQAAMSYEDIAREAGLNSPQRAHQLVTRSYQKAVRSMFIMTELQRLRDCSSASPHRVNCIISNRLASLIKSGGYDKLGQIVRGRWQGGDNAVEIGRAHV